MPYPNTNQNKTEYPWMAQVVHKGKKHRKQHRTRKHAELWEAEAKAALKRGQDPFQSIEKTDIISLHDWATKYLDYAKREFVDKTFSEKRKAFKELFKSEEIDPFSSIEDFEPIVVLNHLQDQVIKRSGNCANKDRKNLAAAWKWGIKYLEFPRLNPVQVVDRFAEERHERYMPTLEEFMAVYDSCSTEQDKLMLWSYLQTGARREELFRLSWKDVDFKKRQIRLKWRKNQKGQWEEAWLPVQDDLMGLLRAHQKVTGFVEYVFLNFQGSKNPKYWVPYQYRQHWLKNLCAEAGVSEFGFHGIRHLFASILASQNVPLPEIQFMLRHKQLATTQRYIHRLKKENREVLEALPGLMKRDDTLSQRSSLC